MSWKVGTKQCLIDRPMTLSSLLSLDSAHSYHQFSRLDNGAVPLSSNSSGTGIERRKFISIHIL